MLAKVTSDFILVLKRRGLVIRGSLKL